MTLTADGETITYRLRGVMRDTDPASAFATVTLEPLREHANEVADEDDDRLPCRRLSARACGLAADAYT